MVVYEISNIIRVPPLHINGVEKVAEYVPFCPLFNMWYGVVYITIFPVANMECYEDTIKKNHVKKKRQKNMYTSSNGGLILEKFSINLNFIKFRPI